MRAIVFDKSNAPEVLIRREVGKPVCHEHEVLVRIIATSINAADYRSMQLGIIPKGRIFGADIAGKVTECGDNARKFKIGDEVFGDLSGCGFGGFAEFVAAPETLLALKPAGVSFQAAAALPVAGVTALQALRDQGKVQPGQKVLVYGAGGGVGHFAVQLASYFGAEVTAVCSPRNISMTRSLGADHVIDYTQEDVLKTNQRFDLILAVNGAQPLYMYRQILAPRGRIVLVGGSYSQVIQGLVFGGLMSMGKKKFRFLAARPNAADLEYIIHLVEEGKITPVVDRCYDLEETSEAMRYIRQGHSCGKVIINVNDIMSG